MKTEEQIKQKIEQLFEKRLEQRYEKYLSKNFRNCLYNFAKDFDNKERFFCTNVKKPEVKEEIICLCENQEACQSCNYYVCKHTKESVKDQMIADISSPSVCGVKEPKLAVLLWVLRDVEIDNNEEAKSPISSFFRKIFGVKEK